MRKNTVDGEHILAIVKNKGYNIIDNPEEADIIIINTCAFIEDSKKSLLILYSSIRFIKNMENAKGL